MTYPKFQEHHKMLKENLKNLLRKLDFNLSGNTTQDEYLLKMNGDPWFAKLPDQEKISTFVYCISKAKTK